jgi:hypothetical protein
MAAFLELMFQNRQQQRRVCECRSRAMRRLPLYCEKTVIPAHAAQLQIVCAPADYSVKDQ